MISGKLKFLICHQKDFKSEILFPPGTSLWFVEIFTPITDSLKLTFMLLALDAQWQYFRKTISAMLYIMYSKALKRAV